MPFRDAALEDLIEHTPYVTEATTCLRDSRRV